MACLTCPKLFTLGLLLLGLLHGSAAQLSYHTDSNSNSFTLKTPSLQQSFSRVYGGSKQQRLQQQQPQPQQALQSPAISTATPQLQRFAQPYVQPQVQQQQQQQQFAQPQQYSSFRYSNAGDAASPYQQQQGLQYAQQSYPGYATSQYATTPATPTYAGGIAQQHYAQTLQQIQQQQLEQQQLEQLQQQQQQQQTHYATQKSATPNQVEQLQAAYLAYAQQQQQQQLQQQQQQQQQQTQYVNEQDYQQQLLRQLYNDHRPTAAAFNAGGSQHTSPIFNTADYANYMHHQQQLAERTFGSAPTAATLTANNGLSSTTPLSPGMSSTTEKLLGLQYSPSNQVSHVKFSSGNLQYNF